jgi:hypothetical protein
MKSVLFLIFLHTVNSFRITKDGLIESDYIECSVIGRAEYYDIDSLLTTREYDTITAKNKRQAINKYLKR